MSYKKFEKSDVFYNVIKTKPRFQFKIWNGEIFLNYGYGGTGLGDLGHAEGCGDTNVLDFSCPETSYNYGLI